MGVMPFKGDVWGAVARQPKANGAAPRKAVSATRAKVLTAEQFDFVLRQIQDNATLVKGGTVVGVDKNRLLRDTVLVMLSFYCGLRAQEIAGLKWRRNILNSAGEIGDVVHVTGDIGKRCVGRVIPINAELRKHLKTLRNQRPKDVYVIFPLVPHDPSSIRVREEKLEASQCHPNTLVQYLRRLYRDCEFVGATSHSGRRTFITNLARRCNEVNSSLRDVQILAGHGSLATTEVYIEPSPHQHNLVNLVF